MKNEQNLSRRNFLKKSAYVVPTIVTLGALETPVEAHGWRWKNSSCKHHKFGNGKGTGIGHWKDKTMGNGTGIGHWKYK